MGAFDDVKVGDTVLIKTTFGAVGFNRGRDFYVTSTVSRVTPKRFVVSEQQCDKKDGRLVGGYGTVFKPGEKPDQQAEAAKYHRRINALYYAVDYICVKHSEIITDDEIDAIDAIIKAIRKRLGK